MGRFTIYAFRIHPRRGSDVIGCSTSDIAIEVNISIMRTFVLLRKQLFDYSELYRRVEQLEQDHIVTNSQLAEIYAASTELADIPKT